MGKIKKNKPKLNKSSVSEAKKVKPLAKKETKEVIDIEGTVIEALPSATFKVELENGHKILAHLSGKMRMHFIKVLPGDRVLIEMTPYDLTKGRITKRF